MKLAHLFSGAMLAVALVGAAQAATVTQEFDSNWQVAPGSNSAAAQWQYQVFTPFNSALGTLEKVTITTTIAGTRDDATDSVAVRYAFFTGWSPNQYQFYQANLIAGGATAFSDTRSFTSGSDFALDNFVNYNYLPLANYYFESKSTLGHSISAKTELTYQYALTSAVPEPATYAMLLAGLGALALAVRRRKASPGGRSPC